jgi:hypothetical protein
MNYQIAIFVGAGIYIIGGVILIRFYRHQVTMRSLWSGLFYFLFIEWLYAVGASGPTPLVVHFGALVIGLIGFALSWWAIKVYDARKARKDNDRKNNLL